MLALPKTIPLRLLTDEYGAIRVGNTRVTLSSLIYANLQGETPEGIHESFDTVSLADIYAVLAYYAENQAAVEDYLREETALFEQGRREAEARMTPEQRARHEALKAQLVERSAARKDAD